MGSSTIQYNFINGTYYSVVFDVTLLSGSEIETLLTISDLGGGTPHVSVGGTSSSVVSTFNTVGLRVEQGTTARFDNVKLEVVPEPSSALISALGCALLAVRRRTC